MHDDYVNGDDYYDDDEHEPCSKKIMPALFAWFLLISTSASYFTLVLPEYINLVGLDQLHLFIGVVAAHSILFLFVLLNFSIATFMDPGRFPKVDIKDLVEDDGNHQSGSYKNVLINDMNVRMKWCTTCQFYRPPRSSHCGVCNACIDTMDHHCPWVCNCIGRRNYKYFLQFLISLTLHMIIILGLCLTLVLFNKNDLTHIPIIISIFLIVIVGILLIPIGGLTGFHLVLVSRGRTTNEQVTGKFRTGVNPFDEGCCKNWRNIVCSSVVPSYMRFRRDKLNQQEYLETKILLKPNIDQSNPTLKQDKMMQNNPPTRPRQGQSNRNRSDETEMAVFINRNSNNNNNSNVNNEVMISTGEVKKSKRGGVSNGQNNRRPMQSQEDPQMNKNRRSTSSTKKVAKITNNGTGYPLAGHRQITSPARQKRYVQNSDFQVNDDDDDEVNQMLLSKQRTKFIRQQQKQTNQHNSMSNNVWVNRNANHHIEYNGAGDYDNTNEEIKSLRSKTDVKHQQQMPTKHSSQKNRNNNINSNSNKINKLMSDSNKRGSIPSTSNESSSNSSNRCIRNNSYLNANHTISLLKAEQENHQNQINLLNNMDLRPSSSSSNSSSSSKNKTRRSKGSNPPANHLHQVHLEIINEKNHLNKLSEKHMPENLPDYASYEITV